MIKLTSLALTATLGFAGLMHSAPAAAGPYVSVGIGLPGVPVVAPPVVAYGGVPVAVYPRPYYYAPPVYPYIGLGYRYGWGFGPGYRHGFGYGRFHGGYRR